MKDHLRHGVIIIIMMVSVLKVGLQHAILCVKDPFRPVSVMKDLHIADVNLLSVTRGQLGLDTTKGELQVH